jgi:hypothetical protein
MIALIRLSFVDIFLFLYNSPPKDPLKSSAIEIDILSFFSSGIVISIIFAI